MALSKTTLANNIIAAIKSLDAGGGETIGDVISADTSTPSANSILTEQWNTVIEELIDYVVDNAYVKLKDDMEALRTAISAAVPVPMDGGVALKTAIMSSQWGTANFSSEIE